jgi:Xaa-Pro aminopeptidase
VHYKPTSETDICIGRDNLYLIDSGAQYHDGTTDVTRTVILGDPTPEQCDRYTRVLKGHIALASCIFPEETAGIHLDALARQYLWREGLDYAHGTGHGVGHFLNVHEGPHRIAKGGTTVPLQPGMIVSNEPGYYKEGAYGIRIESLLLVIESTITSPNGRFLTFETLTMVPLDRKLIKISLLSAEEKEWINRYHQHVFDQISPFIEGKVLGWLAYATQTL